MLDGVTSLRLAAGALANGAALSKADCQEILDELCDMAAQLEKEEEEEE